jgi:hypothetical protein
MTTWDEDWDDWAEELELASIVGPKGSARVLEGFETDYDDSLVVVQIPRADGSYRRARIVYAVDFEGKREAFTSLGEAYIVAGRKAGRPV